MGKKKEKGKERAHINITLLIISPHSIQKRMTHRPRRKPTYIRIRARLVIRAPAKHPHVLPLALPILHELLLAQTIFISIFLGPVMESVKEGFRAAEKHLGIVDLTHGEPALDERIGLRGEGGRGFHVVHEGYVACGVGAVDVREFDGGAGVAAVEEDG